MSTVRSEEYLWGALQNLPRVTRLLEDRSVVILVNNRHVQVYWSLYQSATKVSGGYLELWGERKRGIYTHMHKKERFSCFWEKLTEEIKCFFGCFQCQAIEISLAMWDYWQTVFYLRMKPEENFDDRTFNKKILTSCVASWRNVQCLRIIRSMAQTKIISR